MRLRLAKFIILVIVFVNLLLFFYSLKFSLWQNLELRLMRTFNTLENVEQHSPALNGPQDAAKSLKSLAQAQRQQHQQQQQSHANIYEQLRRTITIVFRIFYSFENDIKDSINSILDVIPNMPIVVYLEGVPYPPLAYESRNSSHQSSANGESKTNVKFVNLKYDFSRNSNKNQLNPLSVIRTKYVLFMPDGVRLNNKSILQKILKEINSQDWRRKATALSSKNASETIVKQMLIVAFAGNVKAFASCTEIQLDFPNWTVQYTAVNATSDHCDLYLQKHAFVVDVMVLRTMADPLAQPFPEMFYIQAKLNNITKVVFPYVFQDGRRLFTAYHTKQRRFDIRRRQFREMYKKLQIKRIIRRVVERAHHPLGGGVKGNIGKDNNANRQMDLVLGSQFSWGNFSLPLITEIDLIGCERMTKSCIGSVYNQRPFYTYLGKHTPPCCLDKLKTTFNHVLEEFENVGIRYWLDNYALRDIIETNNLSPDAYDIDLSFYQSDLERSNALRKAQSKPYVDHEGFYWLKATDGNYYRIQFSKMNQIGVNLLPFEIVGGNVVQANGFFGWKAKSFPVEFLHPMSTVIYLGKSIQCPNNGQRYLKIKNIH